MTLKMGLQHIMTITEILSVILVMVGAAGIFASIMPARKTWKNVPHELRNKWLVIVYLMYFFFAGYLFFVFVLISGFKFPVELLIGGVFLGGAIFVFIIINLAQNTIKRVRDAEDGLRSLNETLEMRVSERTKELDRSYKFTKTVLDSIPDPVCIISTKDSKIVGANSAFLQEIGLEEGEVLGRPCYEVTHHRLKPCDSSDDSCPMLATLETGKTAIAEHIHYDADNKEINIEIRTSPILDENGNVVQVVHMSRDITMRKQAEKQIHYLAYYDSLTGLPNRAFYKELLSRALIYGRRHKTIMATLFIDLDGFKRINDTLGHDIGDELLKAVADSLAKCMRKTDYVARSNDERVPDTVSRLGGDEFIVLLSEISHDRDAARVAGRILEMLSKPFLISGHEVYISASIGIAVFPADGEDVESLLKNSDIAMYHAKELGKNTYQFYTKAMNAAALERLTMENELHKAIERKEFLLHYQPKLNISCGRVTGVEALIRWARPDGRLISPAEFIPIAEERGLIVPIGDWVLQEACSQYKKWQSTGARLASIAVNISKRQLDQQQLLFVVTQVLRDSDIDPSCLELEITEGTIMHDPEKAIATLKRLKDMGVKISIDDFGKGYSSLDNLRRLPLDALKIDIFFTAKIAENTEDRAIVKAIIAMAHSLQLKVIAEGVETKEQLVVLRELGCDEAQGYLFSRPVPADECGRFIRETPLSR
jgi:diguanylate cyclase (GGDEF)-like protein/PAS domain S-box-containing protein